MTRSLINPAIADFLQSIITGKLDLIFDEIAINENSEYANNRLKDTNIGKELKLLVVAIKRNDGEMLFNPSGNTKIKGGDLLLVIGKEASAKKIKQPIEN